MSGYNAALPAMELALTGARMKPTSLKELMATLEPMIEAVIEHVARERIASIEDAIRGVKGGGGGARPLRRQLIPEDRRKHLADAKASGLNDAQYQAKHGLSAGQLKRWRYMYPKAKPTKARQFGVRRKHSPEYKKKIVAEATAARASGKFGAVEAIRKREGLSKSSISTWSTQYAADK